MRGVNHNSTCVSHKLFDIQAKYIFGMVKVQVETLEYYIEVYWARNYESTLLE